MKLDIFWWNKRRHERAAWRGCEDVRVDVAGSMIGGREKMHLER